MKTIQKITYLIILAFTCQVIAQTDAVTILPNGNVGIGTTTPTEKLDVNGNLNVKAKVQENNHDLVPRGTIIMWHGNGSSIPKGWAICDGSNGTPDLRDQFIVGAGKKYPVNDTGGEERVTLKSTEMPKHNHGASGSTNNDVTSTNGNHSHTAREFTGWAEAGGKYWKDLVRRNASTNRATSQAGNHNHTLYPSGGGKSHENRPPYHALYFLMKL